MTAKIRESGFCFFTMPLQFLEFDLSEDTDGLRTWDALASPDPSHNLALLSEIQHLQQYLTEQLGLAGPVDEGHRWDMDLQLRDDAGRDLPLDLTTPPSARITLALSLSGGAELTECLLPLAATDGSAQPAHQQPGQRTGADHMDHMALETKQRDRGPQRNR